MGFSSAVQLEQSCERYSGCFDEVGAMAAESELERNVSGRDRFAAWLGGSLALPGPE
jgi:hypothetical protein